jgi:hypothetical protein
MRPGISRFFTVRIVIIALMVWLGLCLLIGLGVYLISPDKVINVVPTAVVVVVYAPTQTPAQTAAVISPSIPNGSTPSVSTIHIGDFVQISGTGGEGLRIRSAPGVENKALFIGGEAETFEVKDGPVSAGDYTWWYLVSSKDSSRFGWAAGNFLVVTTKP